MSQTEPVIPDDALEDVIQVVEENRELLEAVAERPTPSGEDARNILENVEKLKQ